jgi:hypothetical protein
MVNILVDEGYAYDFLAILMIKNFKNKTENSFLEKQCDEYLRSQIGENKHLHILDSEEFKKLILANSKTFDAVELARYGNISAKEVDNLNMERYNCKVSLQKKFFPESIVLEKKS